MYEVDLTKFFFGESAQHSVENKKFNATQKIFRQINVQKFFQKICGSKITYIISTMCAILNNMLTLSPEKYFMKIALFCKKNS